jgi:formylglycine-generating enzyme required for sulfatase activity
VASLILVASIALYTYLKIQRRQAEKTAPQAAEVQRKEEDRKQREAKEEAARQEAEQKRVEEERPRREEEKQLQAKGMVKVPAGEFFMGCNERVDNACEEDEKPGRTVNLPAFSIDKAEVSVEEYQKCVDARQCPQSDERRYSSCNWGVSGREQHPMNCIDWNQAKTFCEWAGKRLPTEAEWEKAARGTDGRKYPWGDTWQPQKANSYGEDDGFKTTAPVGSFPAGVSPYGNLDMAGNVWEWTQDWYDSKYYQNGPTKNPRGAEKGGLKVARGGSWRDSARGVRVALRRRYGPRAGVDHVGFRCAQ